MQKPFQVLETPGNIMVMDSKGIRCFLVHRDGTNTDAEMVARAKLLAVAMNRLPIKSLKGVV